MYVQISSDKQIEIAVVIVITKRAAGMPGNFPAQTSLFSNLSKCAVAIVPIQQIDTDGTHEYVGPPVVVVIGRIRAGSPIVILEARLLCHVFKAAVPQIMVKINTA